MTCSRVNITFVGIFRFLSQPHKNNNFFTCLYNTDRHKCNGHWLCDHRFTVQKYVKVEVKVYPSHAIGGQ
jgi:hypothetical protein